MPDQSLGASDCLLVDLILTCRFLPVILPQNLLASAVVHPALSRGFDEADDFQRDAGIQRRLAGLEHLDNLLEQLPVDVGRADRNLHDTLLSEGYSAVVGFAGTDAADGGDAAVLPVAGRLFRTFVVCTTDALAAGAHQRVENLDGVDAVV